MPLKTFLNLDEERQKKILNICFEEFALNDYESASLSRIITRLGIAKGSFYRYFENKMALYTYLVDFARDINIRHLDDYFNDPEVDFFEAYVNYFLSIIQKEKEYPYYLMFSFRASNELPREVEQVHLERWNKSRSSLLRQLIEEHQKRGSIRQDVEVETISAFIRHTSFGFRALFYKKYCHSPGQYLSSMEEEELRREINLCMDLVRRGIGT